MSQVKELLILSALKNQDRSLFQIYQTLKKKGLTVSCGEIFSILYALDRKAAVSNRQNDQSNTYHIEEPGLIFLQEYPEKLKEILDMLPALAGEVVHEKYI